MEFPLTLIIKVKEEIINVGRSQSAFSLQCFMGNLLDLENNMLLHARLKSLPCPLSFISSLTYKSEKMYFESILYIIGFVVKFMENAYFIVGCC